MTRRVAITGLGCVSGLGAGVDAAWSAALSGQGAIRDCTLGDVMEPAWRFSGPMAPVAPLDTVRLDARFGARALSQFDPLSTFAVAATLEALEHAGLLDDPVLSGGAAIVYGAGSGGNATLETAYRRLYADRSPRVHPQTIPQSMISAPVSQISMLFGIRGPTFTVSSACASSNHAIGEAMHMIRSGRVKVAITGGAEACLTLASLVGWTAIRAMAPDTCRPFSAGRQGMVLGEGAATLVLEDWEHATARGAPVHGELIGYGAAADAAHLTAPDLDGVVRAIRKAHADAGLATDAPVLISSHGTGTLLNDRTEAAAIRSVYGALDDCTVIATKSAHGHLVGGSGALELVLGLRALREGVAPAVLNRLEPDPECDLPLALEPTRIETDVVVSNSFAFGGLNAVLIARGPTR